MKNKTLDKKVKWLEGTDFIPAVGMFRQINRTRNYNLSIENVFKYEGSKILLVAYNSAIVYGLWEMLK